MGRGESSFLYISIAKKRGWGSRKHVINGRPPVEKERRAGVIVDRHVP